MWTGSFDRHLARTTSNDEGGGQMKRVTLGLAVLALLFGGGKLAKAGLIGSTVDTKLYYPDLNSLLRDYGEQVVNPAAFFSSLDGETTTITNTQIIYISPSYFGIYNTGIFNGYVYDFLNSGNLITKATVDPSSTLSGFDPSKVKLTSDGAGGQLVELNLNQGLFFSPGASVVLDVTTSAVPEPSTLTLLGIAALGLFVAARPRTTYRMIAVTVLSFFTASSFTDYAHGQSQKKGSKSNKAAIGIADPSEWEVRLSYPDGTIRKAGLRFRDGVAYPATNKVTVAGTMRVDDSGNLHIVFKGHPRVPNGEAVLQRIAEGQWHGTLAQETGEVGIELSSADARGQAQKKAPKPPKPITIADPSNWEVWINYPNGTTQKAAILLRDGVVYPAINKNASGRAFVDDAGDLHIFFEGHPKVYMGEAVLKKIADGKWKGVLVQGEEIGNAEIEMSRKK
jgi:hypothetical protein